LKPSEIIDKALTEVMPDESHWMQGDLCNDDGQYCMAGAMQQAAGALHKFFVSQEYGDYLAARRFCLEVIAEQHGVQTLPHFNDSYTYDEVRAVMEKARSGLQEAGQ
jgi:hypothetical protein